MENYFHIVCLLEKGSKKEPNIDVPINAARLVYSYPMKKNDQDEDRVILHLLFELNYRIGKVLTTVGPNDFEEIHLLNSTK